MSQKKQNAATANVHKVRVKSGDCKNSKRLETPEGKKRCEKRKEKEKENITKVNDEIDIEKEERVKPTPKSKPDKSKSKVRDREYLQYKRYLKSERFREVRERCFERDRHECQFCGWGPGKEGSENDKSRCLTCHHREYTHLGAGGDTELNDVITLCNVCHQSLHRVVENYSRFNEKKMKNKVEGEGEEALTTSHNFQHMVDESEVMKEECEIGRIHHE